MANSKLKKAKMQVDKGQYDLARQSLSKLKATPENEYGKSYLTSLIYFHKGAEWAFFDSSYFFLNHAKLLQTAVAPPKLAQLSKIGIDSLAIRLQAKRLDSLGFAIAQRTNTEASYQQFIERRPTAYQTRQAIKLRNQIAFEVARKQNTYEAYRLFLDKYPDAEEAHNALDVYQVLLYESETKSGKEKDLADFIANYPANPYVGRAISQLYYIRVAGHDVEAYRRFARDYVGSSEGRQALNWLALIAPKSLDTTLVRRYGPDAVLPNWLRHPADTVYAVTDSLGRYHFMDGNGKIVLRANLPRLPDEMYCRPIAWTRVMGLTAGMRQHLRWLAQSQSDTLKLAGEIEETGTYALRMGAPGHLGLWHRGGWQLLPPEYEEITALEDRLLAAKRQGKWGLYTMQGKAIYGHQLDEVELEDGMLLLTQNKRMALVPPADLLRILSRDTVNPAFDYDDVAPAGGGQFLVRINRQWGVTSADGRRLVPVRYDHIDATGQTLLLHSPEGVLVANREGKLLNRTIYEKVQFNSRFIGVRADGKWGVLDLEGNTLQPTTYDSLQFLGRELLLATMAGRQFMGFGTVWKDFGIYSNVSLLYNKPDSGKARTAYLLVTNKTGKLGLYNQSGKVVLPAQYDVIDFASANILIVAKAGKTGLADTTGRPVLPLLYSGAGFVRGQYIAVVQKEKFGLFDMKAKRLIIPAKYESAPQYYGTNNQLLILRKSGMVGMFTSGGKQVAPPSYDDVRYWTEDIALVRQRDRWYFYDIPGMRRSATGYADVVLEENLPRVLMVASTAERKGAIYNMTGLVSPFEFDQVKNIGTLTRPLLMASREAGGLQTTISYFNAKGKLLQQVTLPTTRAKELCQ